MPHTAIMGLGGDLVLAAEASAALIADDADVSSGGVAIVGSASLAAGGGLIK